MNRALDSDVVTGMQMEFSHLSEAGQPAMRSRVFFLIVHMWFDTYIGNYLDDCSKQAAGDFNQELHEEFLQQFVKLREKNSTDMIQLHRERFAYTDLITSNLFDEMLTEPFVMEFGRWVKESPLCWDDYFPEIVEVYDILGWLTDVDCLRIALDYAISNTLFRVAYRDMINAATSAVLGVNPDEIEHNEDDMGYKLTRAFEEIASEDLQTQRWFLRSIGFDIPKTEQEIAEEQRRKELGAAQSGGNTFEDLLNMDLSSLDLGYPGF